ncbi:MAG: hypothetical protein ACM30I_17905 [Gemmatimonas sp.]
MTLKSIPAVFGIAGMAAMAISSQAVADTAQEIRTAAEHAGLATQATSKRTVQMHLHHVINCLVGPNGDGFDASAGNPCDGQGDGAIPDSRDGAQRQRLNDALLKATNGLGQPDLGYAQRDAADAQAVLSGM